PHCYGLVQRLRGDNRWAGGAAANQQLDLVPRQLGASRCGSNFREQETIQQGAAGVAQDDGRLIGRRAAEKTREGLRAAGGLQPVSVNSPRIHEAKWTAHAAE